MTSPAPPTTTPSALPAGYRAAARLTRQFGTTYYWGTLLLPPAQRRDVYAIYALCRLADDIVDEPGSERARAALGADAPEAPGERLAAFQDLAYAALNGAATRVPILQAVADTVRRRRIARDCFDRFFGAMTLDLTRTTWPTWSELRDGYMEGSAAVIGEMMLPILRPSSPDALQPARALGLAFQLTNFIRDVGEDLDRGRVYLPQDDLARHGADPWLRRVTPAWRSFLAEQIARNRNLYREARPGIDLLPGASSRCVAAAWVLYRRILDRIEAADYDVFTARHRVSTLTKGLTAAGSLAGLRPRGLRAAS